MRLKKRLLAFSRRLHDCFFSSRRRHTISYGDWSSDVCSSDLLDGRRPIGKEAAEGGGPLLHQHLEIGRASCRERVLIGVVLVLLIHMQVWLTPYLRIKKSLLKCNWTIRKRLPR